MTHINLLPWREQRREERKQHFLVALGVAALLSALIMGSVHLTIAHLVTEQNNRNKILKDEIVVLNQKIHHIRALKKLKLALIARMEVIKSLQAHRSQVVHLFDELITILPKDIHLTRVARKKNVITLYGLANSNSSISHLMRNITRSKWLSTPTLHEIKVKSTENNKRINQFELNLLLVQEHNNSGNKL